MTRRITIVLAMAFALGACAGRAQEIWKMRIHKATSVDEYILAEIDSMTFFVDTTVVPLVTVPAGSFIMGDGVASCGVDEHEVTLTRDFHLGQHEVTNREYLEMVQWAYDRGYVTASVSSVQDNLDGSTEELLDLDNEYCEIQFDGAGTFYLRESPSGPAQGAYPTGYDPSHHPVKEATWYGMAAFCDWLSLREGLPRAYDHATWECNGGDPYGAGGYRLPTDAEWEYAAQYDDERAYPWGDEDPGCDRANYWETPDGCVGWTSPVGSYPQAPGILGLSDMPGNLWEWCHDWHVCDLGTMPQVDPPGPASGTHRVMRCGGFGSVWYDLRCALRALSPPEGSTYALGFRVARTYHPLNHHRSAAGPVEP